MILLHEWNLLWRLLLVENLLLLHVRRRYVAVGIVCLLDFLLQKRIELAVMVRACDGRFGRGVCFAICRSLVLVGCLHTGYCATTSVAHAQFCDGTDLVCTAAIRQRFLVGATAEAVGQENTHDK